MPDTPGPSWADRSAVGRWAPLAAQWINGAGPAAMGLAAIAIVPLALSWTGRTWLGLLLLAGATLLWWTIAVIGRQAAAPSTWHLLPVVLLLAVALSPAFARGPQGFFTTRAEAENNTAAQRNIALDREAAMVAAEQLLVVLLLALPLRNAVWMTRWADSWFRLALLLGSAGLLVVTAIGLPQPSSDPADPLAQARLSMLAPTPLPHSAGTLCALAAWAACSMLAGWATWKVQRRRDLDSDQPTDIHNVFLFQAALSTLVAAGSLAVLAATCMTGSSAANAVGWRCGGAWAMLAGGLALAVLMRRRLAQLAGLLIAAFGVIALVSQWPGGIVSESLRLGGLLGSGSDDWTFSLESPGLLWLLRWRGVAGLAVVVQAGAIAVAFQLRAIAREPAGPTRLASGGAAVGSWVMALQWLFGPVSMTGSAAFLGLALWALSLGPAAPPTPRLPRGNLLAMMAIVVSLFGLAGLTPTMHDPLWFRFEWSNHDAEILHGIWGLYITLICCLGFAPFGRPASLIGGLVLSVGLAFGAQLIKPLVGRVCEWDHGAAQALAALPIIVILFLMPYRWTSASSVEPRRGEADRPMESDY